MNNNSNIIRFEYEFTSDKSISNRKSRDVPAIEFYKSIVRWKEKGTEDNIPGFYYNSIEFNEYDNGAILSMVPFSNKARLKSIWVDWDNDNVFEQQYIVTEFSDLELKPRDDIEEFYDIKLYKFISHIPYQLCPWMEKRAK